jgi:hypothetical protein
MCELLQLTVIVKKSANKCSHQIQNPLLLVTLGLSYTKFGCNLIRNKQVGVALTVDMCARKNTVRILARLIAVLT